MFGLSNSPKLRWLSVFQSVQRLLPKESSFLCSVVSLSLPIRLMIVGLFHLFLLKSPSLSILTALSTAWDLLFRAN